MCPRADLKTCSSHLPSIRGRKIINGNRQTRKEWKHDSNTADPTNSTEN